MSDDELQAAMPMILSDQYKLMEKYMGEITAADRKKEEAKLKAVFAEARKMSDLDYQVQKSRLGAQIPCDYMEVRDRVLAIGKELCKVESEKNDGKSMGVVGQMFLRPCMVPILAKRMNILEGWENYDAVDLDKVKAAAQCKGGTCAID